MSKAKQGSCKLHQVDHSLRVGVIWQIAQAPCTMVLLVPQAILRVVEAGDCPYAHLSGSSGNPLHHASQLDKRVARVRAAEESPVLPVRVAGAHLAGTPTCEEQT